MNAILGHLNVGIIAGALHRTAARNHNLGEGQSRTVCQSEGAHDARAQAMLTDIEGNRWYGARIDAPASVGDLGAAWAEAEAALPDGWKLSLHGPHAPELRVVGCDRGHSYYAEASQPFAEAFVPKGQSAGFRVQSGLTQEAALRALTVALRTAFGDAR
jgi:hypothetical protein